MNKKFSTLMASALLATSVGAFAQGLNISRVTGEIRSDNKYYVIDAPDGSAIDMLVGVAQDPATGVFQFKVINESTLTTLARVDSVLWSVEPRTVEGGFVRFVLTNKATGIELSFDTDKAVIGNSASPTATSKEIGGNMRQWKWYDSRYENALWNGTNDIRKSLSVDFSNGTTDSTMVVKWNRTDNTLFVAKEEKSKTITGQDLIIRLPGEWVMSAEDLNTKGDDVKYMQLDFAEDIEGNPFAEKWQAQQIVTSATAPYQVYRTGSGKAGFTNGSPEYLFLNKINADGELSYKYLHIDTAYYESTGASYKLYNTLDSTAAIMVSPAATVNGYQSIDHMANNLPDDAFRFKFTKNLMTDSIKIESFSQFVELANGVTPHNPSSSSAVTYWTMLNGTDAPVATISSNVASGAATGVQNNNGTLYTVLSHCTLVSENKNVITFYDDDVTAARPVDNYVNLWAYADGIGDDYTSIADGVYTIQDAETGEYLGVHIYSPDSLATFTGNQAIANMNFNHIPAFQWVIWKNDRASAEREAVSPVTIVNREFNIAGNIYAPVQLRTSKDANPAQNQFYFGLFGGREVIIEKVADEYIKDKHLGYKYLADDTLDVNRYTFNYWHAYAQDRYLALNDNDSLLNVLTTDASRFILTGNTETPYGFNPAGTPAATYIDGLVQLSRRSYNVAIQGVGTIYNNKEDQYMVTNQPSTADDAIAEFYFKENNEFEKDGETLCYYALIDLTGVDSKAGVVDNDTQALLWSQVISESRTSVFAVEEDDAPLYRRFNNTNLGESATDARDSLRFYENARGEYLMDEVNPTWQVEGMNYVGMWTADKAEAGLAFIVDTAWVNRGLGYKKPQYVISVAHNDFAGIRGEDCTEDGPHFDFNGNPTDAAHCIHAHMAVPGFQRAKYMISFADSAAANGQNVPYTDIRNGYTRVGFVEAIRVADTLWVLPAEFKALANEDINFTELQAYNDSVVAEGETAIKNLLTGNNHKNYTWSFRYVNPENAGNVTEEGENNQFLIESNKYGSQPDIAPQVAAWLKIQNGCVVLTNDDATFANAKTGGDGALIFNVNGDNVTEDDLATDNEEITASAVTVIAGNGQITIAGAAGKKVVVSNILGQVVANTVLTSDNATIAAPQGVVVVAVEGEEAVKAIVK